LPAAYFTTSTTSLRSSPETIEILSEAVAHRPELAAIANLIDQAATRGAKLTSHLLAFARGQPSLPRQIDVDALIGEAASSAARDARRADRDRRRVGG